MSITATASATFDAPTLDRLRADVNEVLAALDASPAPDAWRDRLISEAFFRRADPVYLQGRELTYILAQWRDLAAWVQERQEGEIRIRIFNPTKESHGYYLNRTVLQTCMADQPFIFDSLDTLLRSMDLPPLRCIHPVVGVQRFDDGSLEAIDPLPESLEDTSGFESMMHFELPRMDESTMHRVELAVRERLLKIRAVVTDHTKLRGKCRWLASHLGEYTVTGSTEYYRTVSLIQKFFHWLVDDNYVFVGYAEFRDTARGEAPPTLMPESLLGQGRLAAEAGEEVSFPADAMGWLDSDEVIYLGKGARQAEIHRTGKLDLIAVRLHEEGHSDRICVFSGLYTYKAIREDISRIPLLRAKLDTILRDESAVVGSMLSDKLQRGFRALPVEFLLEADCAAISRALGLVNAAEEGGETAVHLIAEPGARAAFVLVSLSRDRFSDDVRQSVVDRLMGVLGANYVDSRVAPGHGGNVVLQLYLTASKRFRELDPSRLEAAVSAVTDSWQDQLSTILKDRIADGEVAEWMVDAYVGAFPDEYTHSVRPSEALEDVLNLERCREEGMVRVAVSSVADDLVSGVTRLKIYQLKKIYLTDSTPVLDHFGLRVIDQNSWTVSIADGEVAYVDTFRVVPEHRKINLEDHIEHLVHGLSSVLRHESRDDRLNNLILTAGLDHREVEVLRAYIAHARQLGATDPVPVVLSTWNRHPKAASLLMRLFRSRFNPLLGAAGDADRARLVERNHQAFVNYLDDVELASEDRVLRRSGNLVMATLRTNHWSGATKEGHPLALKIDCSAVDQMPAPRPYREIFIHHLDVEGVHLRGGPVARGGLRWSDRPADFRTEILGLMDTQMVKNVLIVPVGAKGGFVLKRNYATRAEARTAADQLYKVFIRGLLDVTDNVVDGEVVPPIGVVRYDGDDPYLVVAADKGTAHLSDTANSIAIDYGFWLGDAFASGGSAGYDHKAYGITAKGGWVCVRRHFRELGLDPEKDVITVAGIGDMGGDVFGNGLLLSKTVKLLATFNHMHIFLDPDPDPATSWVERKRLFDTPRTTWDDYDRSLMSKGSGIFSRTAKSIPLTKQVRTMLGVEVEEMSADEVVTAILHMEADLLWNGGIGTYVKASYETDRDAGDPANDALRVNADELRFRVVGEGGNLGFTQAARVEFSSKGGRINSDAVDNSGGVDMSDHEVNLKILFASLERSGDITREQRDATLLKIAEQVSDDVQRNNHDHSLMISLDVARSAESLNGFRIVLNDLEDEGRLDRARHRVPDDGEMVRRQRTSEGLLRPELTRIGPLVKMKVYEELLADERFDTPYIERWLMDYFPKAVRDGWPEAIRGHQLHKEIAATVITNRLVDAMGVTHFSKMERVTGRDMVEIAYASLIAADLLDTWKLKGLLRDIDGVRASVEYVKLRHVEESVSELAQWLLQRPIDVLDANAVVARFRPGFETYERALGKIIDRSEKREYQRRQRYLRNRNIRVPGAERAAALELLVDAGEAVLLSEESGIGAGQAGMLLKRVAASSQLLLARQLALPADARDGWEVRAITELRANIAELISVLATKTLTGSEIDEKAKGRKLQAALTNAWETYRESNASVFYRADGLARRIEVTRARGLAPAMVLYGAVRVLQGS